MTRVVVFVLVSLLPSAAWAQSASSLGDPTSGRPAPQTVTVAPATPSAQLAQAPVQGIDPEIVAMRSAEPRRVRASGGSSWRYASHVEPGLIPRSGPSFLDSWGHAWAGLGIGVGGGALLGGAVGCGIFTDFCLMGMMIGVPFGAGALAPIGAAVGTWAWGEQAGGTGNFFASLGLSVTGAGIGVLAAWLITDGTQTAWGAIIGPVSGMILSTLGAAIGYHITSHGPADLPATASTGPTLFPTVAPTEDQRGGTIGVAGTF